MRFVQNGSVTKMLSQTNFTPFRETMVHDLNPHQASAATLTLPPVLLLPLKYIGTLGNGSGTDFQASPHYHRPALAADTATDADTDARCG